MISIFGFAPQKNPRYNCEPTLESIRSSWKHLGFHTDDEILQSILDNRTTVSAVREPEIAPIKIIKKEPEQLTLF